MIKLASELKNGDKVYNVGQVRTVTKIEPQPAEQLTLTFDNDFTDTVCSDKRYVFFAGPTLPSAKVT